MSFSENASCPIGPVHLPLSHRPESQKAAADRYLRGDTMKIKRRNMIANEILATERSYHQGMFLRSVAVVIFDSESQGLQTLVTMFQEPLLAQKIITHESARTIF